MSFSAGEFFINDDIFSISGENCEKRSGEPFSNTSGALLCVLHNVADVAFIPHYTVLQHIGMFQ